MTDPKQPPNARALLLGGLLPLAAYTAIEYQYGILWGLIAGMALGVFEILWEWRTRGKVSPVTWGANGMILLLGGVSLATQDGIWFKLQPAILEGAMAVAMIGSVALGRPLLLLLAEKQGGLRPDLPPRIRTLMEGAMRGMTLRSGLFLLVHAALATWAAFYWSTAAWVALKGIGFTVSFLVYLLAEVLLLRYRISNLKSSA